MHERAAHTSTGQFRPNLQYGETPNRRFTSIPLQRYGLFRREYGGNMAGSVRRLRPRRHSHSPGAPLGRLMMAAVLFAIAVPAQALAAGPTLTTTFGPLALVGLLLIVGGLLFVFGPDLLRRDSSKKPAKDSAATISQASAHAESRPAGSPRRTAADSSWSGWSARSRSPKPTNAR